MSRVELSRGIDAPASAIWDVLVDVRRLPEISPSTTRVEAPPRLERVGDEFRQTVVLAGRHFTSTWAVTRFEAGTCLAVAGSVLPGTRYTMTERVRGDGARRSTLQLVIEYSLPFGPIGRLAAKLGAERRALDEARSVLDGIAELVRADAASSPKRGGP